MLKLNRTTEYGLIAINYIRSKAQGEVASAREIADHFNLPFEILAKTLQKLKEQGIIASTYGTRGGYVLARDLRALNFADFLGMMEGPVAVVNCTHSGQVKEGEKNSASCEYMNSCNIKPSMQSFNERLHSFLNRISVEELTRSPLSAPDSQSSGSNPENTEHAALALRGEEP